jgi:DNA-binding XRE family transcriptional regulator
VARVVGVDEMTIVGWEKSQGLPIRYSKIQALSRFLGLKYRRPCGTFQPLAIQTSTLFLK